MNIKKLAEKTGLSNYTLRYYEKIGLINGIYRDKSGYRIYSKDDIALIQVIPKLKEAGMSLEDIKEYLALYKQGARTIPARIDLYIKQYKKTKCELEKLKKQAEKLHFKISVCQRSLGMQTKK